MMIAAGCLLVEGGTPHKESPKHVCVAMKNADNMQYVMPIELGSPGQTMNAIPDTGSFELVIPSTDCGDGCRGHPLFNSTRSATFLFRGVPQVIHYGQGDVNTEVDYDTVKLGGMEVQQQSLLKMTHNGLENYDSATYDAVMGLGMSEFARPGDEDLSLLASMSEKVFGICLGQGDGEAGRLDLGGGVPGLDYKELPATQGSGHWGLMLSEFTVGSTAVGDKHMSAIVDSGTSLFAVPTALFDASLNAIGEVAEDCSNIHTLPDMHLTVDETTTFTIPPDLYVGLVELDEDEQEGFPTLADPFRFRAASAAARNRARARARAKRALRASATQLAAPRNMSEHIAPLRMAPQGPDGEQGETICMPLFMELNVYSDDGPLFILGMPFLRAYASRFNLATQKIGFAEIPLNSGKCTPCDGNSNSTGPVATSADAGEAAARNAMLPPAAHALLDPAPPARARPRPVNVNLRKAMLPWWAVHQSTLVANETMALHASSVLGHPMAHSAEWRYIQKPGHR